MRVRVMKDSVGVAESVLAGALESSLLCCWEHQAQLYGEHQAQLEAANCTAAAFKMLCGV